MNPICIFYKSNLQGTTLTWRRPCDPSSKSPALGYIIHQDLVCWSTNPILNFDKSYLQQDERHHREATVKLAPVTNLTVSHTFDPNKLAMGSRLG